MHTKDFHDPQDSKYYVISVISNFIKWWKNNLKLHSNLNVLLFDFH